MVDLSVIDVSATHPQYNAVAPLYEKVNDVYTGSECVKDKGTLYLPPIASHANDDGSLNEEYRRQYENYKLRAIFHDSFRDGVVTFLGLMHQKPATFSLPDKMKYLIDKSTATSDPLSSLLRQINLNQLTSSRLGLLVDVGFKGFNENKPYIALYIGERLTNWAEDDRVAGSYKIVVLDESGPALTDTLMWEAQKKHRVLFMDDTDEFMQALYVENELEKRVKPTFGNVTPKEMPFVIINANDILPDAKPPIMMDVVDLALSIYRSEADFRQNLHMQGQDTLILKGVSGDSRNASNVRVGAGNAITLSESGDAKFIGLNGAGLTAQSEAIKNDLAEIGLKTGQFSNGTGSESAEAMRTKIVAMTTMLTDIATAGAEGLTKTLKHIGNWMNLSDEDINSIRVTPNYDFTNAIFNMQYLIQLITSRNLGAPISLESIHKYMVENGLTRLTLQEELAKIKEDKGYVVHKIVQETLNEMAERLAVENTTGTSGTTDTGEVGIRQSNENTISLTNDPTKTDSQKDNRS